MRIGRAIKALIKSLRMEREWINTGCAIVGAFSALSIPIVLNYQAQENRENDLTMALETRTMAVMADLDRKISDVVSKKHDLDNENKKFGKDRFEHEYIANDPKVEAQVFSLLNEYDLVCLGVNNNLFSKRVLKELRGDALHQTWSDYGPYIAKHRQTAAENAHAWDQCDKLAN
jgi:uncharacterized protein DUF4760